MAPLKLPALVHWIGVFVALHDRKVMAPLKPGPDRRPARGMRWTLHDRKVMAPLKLPALVHWIGVFVALHDRKVMAPLKHDMEGDALVVPQQLSVTLRSRRVTFQSEKEFRETPKQRQRRKTGTGKDGTIKLGAYNHKLTLWLQTDYFACRIGIHACPTLVAVMRKLLLHLHAVARRGTTWLPQEKWQSQPSRA